MRKALLSFFLVLAFPLSAGAVIPSCIDHSVPHAQLVGEARITYMTMDIYDAALYAPHGLFAPDRPLALSLTYSRDLKGSSIADRSIEEIRNQGFTDEVTLAAWHEKITNIFPDVENGTNLTGVLNNEGTTIFYEDNEEIGRISDPSFGEHFFSIWLGSKTSEPDVRKNLLNLKG